MAPKIYLALFWHQHQPYYKDLKEGRAILPWVRLHATKDYYDMAALLDRYPKIRMTINLVPSLVHQLEEYAAGRLTDPWLEKSLQPAGSLTLQDKCWILENFFFCNWDTMIFPHPRYAELFERRGRFTSRQKIERSVAYFTESDFLDLQVWFNLAWMDPLWREQDSTIAHLFKKGRDFTEGEKKLLLDKHREICGLVTPKHRELWDKGQIEVSTTPFYHPILPLLCDTDSAQMAMPGSLKPRKRFTHPEDARAQVEKGLAFMEQRLGRRPVGMWPSEGSVSEEAIRILADCGVQWAATDEAVLFRSLDREKKPAPREALFQPYRASPAGNPPMQTTGESRPQGGSGVQMVFRDHGLSDAIGFVYARMDAARAVDDFVTRLVKIADWLPDTPLPPIVPVILDGENCWEFYARDGHDFLNLLYSRLSDHPRIETTTIGGYLSRFPAREKISKLWAGSWINSDFRIWIGHPEDNRAWDLVSEARDFLTEHLAAHPELKDSPEAQKAWESLYIAEGSDWCWWYGDQNSTAHDSAFDELFRSHVKNVYAFLGAEPPQKLNIAIKGKEQRGQELPPFDLIHPKVDGLITNYYEWRAGGIYQIGPMGGAMHQAENFLTSFHYGFDLENLYLRLDPRVPLRETPLENVKIKVVFIEPVENELQIHWEPVADSLTGQTQMLPKGIFLNAKGETQALDRLAAKKIIELAVPFQLLKIKPNDPFEFAILVIKDGLQLERWPYASSIRSRRPAEDFGADSWTV